MADKKVSVGKKVLGGVGGVVIVGAFVAATASDGMSRVGNTIRRRLEGDDRSAQNDINSPSPHK